MTVRVTKAELTEALGDALEELAAFKAHLHTDKFRGSEWVCSEPSGCGKVYAAPPPAIAHSILCPDCHAPLHGERKDWISTSDVLARLQHIEAALRRVL